VGFLLSSVSRFFLPAQNAVLPLIVHDKNDLLAANGLMQIVQTLALLAGPALAGFSIALWGEQVAFVVDSVTYLISAVAIMTMTVPHTTAAVRRATRAAGEALAAVWVELREGLAYLFGNRTMAGILICLSVVQLGVGAIHVIWVPFLQRTFGLGPEGLGAVDTAQGLGMALGGFGLGFVASRFRQKALAAWGIVLLGVLIALTGLAPSFSLVDLVPRLGVGMEMAAMTVGQRLLYMPLVVLLLMILFGIVMVPAQSALMTMMQLAVPDLKRGRVGSALNALTTVAGLLSMAVASALGDVVALRTIYFVAGLFTMAGGVVGLWALEEPEGQPDDQEFEDVVGPVQDTRPAAEVAADS